jgi:1-aminocyclopropane-1-carboxylate deaminase/D-cysteine desulfhydrase-like pyridoxal-dependent ACC family enzyme
MELTIFDRLIILNQILRKYDTRENILIKKAIDEKIRLSDSEKEVVKIEYLPNNQVDISFKTVDAITKVTEYDFTDGELGYMRESVERINSSGMYSEETMSTYDRIMEASGGIETEAEQEQAGI